MPDADRKSISVADYVRAEHSPLSHLAHQWELHSAILLSPAEERTMVREPAQAVPDKVAERIGRVRVLLVPYISCEPEGDLVRFTKPEGGENHTSVWLEFEGLTHLLLACREMDAHDTGFELLASVAELLHPRVAGEEMTEFERLLKEELRQGITGEIDEEAVHAKRLLEAHRDRDDPEQFKSYRDVALVETIVEYMHGLWHDVQIRTGPDHLPVPQLRLRMALLERLYPPNEGYQVFDKEIEAAPISEEGTPDS